MSIEVKVGNSVENQNHNDASFHKPRKNHVLTPKPNVFVFFVAKSQRTGAINARTDFPKPS